MERTNLDNPDVGRAVVLLGGLEQLGQPDQPAVRAKELTGFAALSATSIWRSCETLVSPRYLPSEEVKLLQKSKNS